MLAAGTIRVGWRHQNLCIIHWNLKSDQIRTAWSADRCLKSKLLSFRGAASEPFEKHCEIWPASWVICLPNGVKKSLQRWELKETFALVSWSHHEPRLLFRSRGYKFGALFMPLHFISKHCPALFDSRNLMQRQMAKSVKINLLQI